MKKKNDYTKLRGGYYTCNDIARSLISWVAPKNGETILEPSSGDGAFLRAVSNYCIEKKIEQVCVKSIELDCEEASKSSAIYSTACSDYFTYFRDNLIGTKVDVLVGNPPFIRYQNFDHGYREVAFELMNLYGFHPNKLTNIWVPFLLLSSELLSDKGRIAMVIPAELFQVNYAAEARKYLMNRFSRLTLVLANEMLFTCAQQEIVLVLGEIESENPGIYTTTIDNISKLADITFKGISNCEIKRMKIYDDKWTRYYMSNDDIELINRIFSKTNVYKAHELFEVNVGIVTGDNDYFIIDDSIKQQHSITQCLPIVTGTDFLDGLIFEQEDFIQKSMKKRSFLFYPESDVLTDLPPGERSYVKMGESGETPFGFKCRNRKCWYNVPISWRPDAFFFRQVGSYPRIVLNFAESYTTDTLHKIRFKNNVNPLKVACAFLNSFTYLYCELIGRSYGGGVLTFEPSEVRTIPIPIIDSYEPDISAVDFMIRNGDIEKVIESNDKLILQQGLGFTEAEISQVHSIYLRLKERRLSRSLCKRQ